MKNLICICIISFSITLISCSKSNCKECTGCSTLPSTTLCEEDFEKTSNYNDQVENYESDGCNCTTK